MPNRFEKANLPLGLLDLEEYLAYLIDERVAELWAEGLRRDPEYQRLRKQFDDFMNDLLALLPKEGSKPVLEAIRETVGVLEKAGGAVLYRQGFKDGAGLARMLER